MRTDEAYLEQLRKDPEQGMADLLEDFTPLVWTAAARYLRDVEDVRECVNDTFAQFYFQREKFDPAKGTLKGLLATIARRRALDRLRRNRAEVPLDEELPAPEALSPDDRLDLMAALEKLSDQDAEMLRLKYFDGLTARQIAQKLGLTPDAVKKRQQRSLKKLRKSLLVAFVLAILALLVACGWAVLRYFGILPGYGVNTDAETPFYILEESVSAGTDAGTVTVEDAVAKEGELSLTVVLDKGPAAADQVNTLPDGTRWTVYWYDLLTSYSGQPIEARWEGGQAVCTGVTTTGPGQGPDGTMNTDVDRMEYRFDFACDTRDWEGDRTVTLDLGWVQADFSLGPAREDALDRYAYALGTWGGVLALPQVEDGRLLVDLYPLSGETFQVEPGVVRTAYGDSGASLTATGPDGAARTGESVQFNPYGDAPCSRWDFGPAEPGTYTLHIPCVYLSAPLPQDLEVALPEGGGPWQVPGGRLTAQVEPRTPDAGMFPPDAAENAVSYDVFFEVTDAQPGLTLAGLRLSAASEGQSMQTVGDVYDDSGRWTGLRASFGGGATAPRLTAAPAGNGLGMGGTPAELCYRWDQSFSIVFEVK